MGVSWSLKTKIIVTFSYSLQFVSNETVEHLLLQETSCGGPIRELTRSESATKRTAATGKCYATTLPPWCTWKSTMKLCRKVQDPFLFVSQSLFAQLKSRCLKTFCGSDVLLWWPRAACLLWEHLLLFLWAPFDCAPGVFLCSQAPICAVTTMETAPSCACPPPRPPGPACARLVTACAQGSSHVRVRKPHTVCNLQFY